MVVADTPWAKAWRERFWRKIARGGPDDCWPWRGATSKVPLTRRATELAYGRVVVCFPNKGPKVPVRTHRIAVWLTRGEDPFGKTANHRCHNPFCNNPAHIYLGTQQDNVRDQVAGGHLTGRRSRASVAARLADLEQRTSTDARSNNGG